MLTQAACAGNTRGYYSEYGNSWFNKRENNDAYLCLDHITTATTPVTDEEIELWLQSNLHLVQE